MHQESVFAAVFVVAAHHARGSKSLNAEEELSGEIRFAHGQGDPRATVARELANQLRGHLGADAETPISRQHGKVHDVQLGLVQLINHEADHFLSLFGHHADAVPLPQTA